MRVRAGARSDVGRVRQGNEDSYLAADPLFVVADGMGGHQGGEVASSMAVEALRAIPTGAADPFASVVSEIRQANRSILARGEGDPGLRGMGTTLTAVLVLGDRARLVHVGDSRAYLFRDGKLRQLTEDHTLVQQLVREGRLRPEDASRHPHRSVVTRALGVEEEVPLDELTEALWESDRVIVCSDGLTNMVEEDRIRAVLESTPDPQHAADRLVEEANRAGGDDNITVIVIDVEWSEDGAGADRATRVTGVPVEAHGADAVAGAVHPVAPPDEEVPGSTTAGETEALTGGRRRLVTWAVVAIVLAVGVVVGGRIYIDRQWYVGVYNSEVTIYRGIPTTVLGYRLSHVAETTGLPADQALQLQFYQDLPNGITASSLEEAQQIVAEIRTTLTDEAATGTP